MKAWVGTGTGYRALAAKDIGWIRDELIYFRVQFMADLKPGQPTETYKKPAYEKWEKFMNKQRDNAPEGLNNFA